LRAPASLHAEVHGRLPHVDFGVHAGLGRGSLDVNGKANVSDKKMVVARFHAKQLDARDFDGSLPASVLGLLGEVNAEMDPGGALSGRVDARFPGGSVEGNDVPPAAATGSVSRTAAGDLTAHAAVTVEATYAPTTINVAVRPSGKAMKVDVDLRSDVPEIDAVPFLQHAVQGAMHVEAKASVDTASMSLDADVQAEARHIAQGSNELRFASIDAKATGPAGNPQVHAVVRSEGLVVSGRHLTSARLTVLGSARTPHVAAAIRASDLPDVDADLDLALQGGLAVHGVRVGLTGEGEHAVVTAKNVGFADGTIRADGVRVEGLGSPVDANVVYAAGSTRVKASTLGVSLERIGHLAHMEKSIRGGMLALDADVQSRGSAWDGRAKVDLKDAAVDQLEDFSAHVEMVVDGRRVIGKIHANDASIGSIDVDIPKLDIGGGALATAWRRTSGQFDVDVRGDLARLSAVLPPDTLPFSEAKGRVALKAHFERDSAFDMTPDLNVALSTDRLTLAGRIDQTRDIPGTRIVLAPWRLEGLDFHSKTEIDGRSGKLVFDTEVRDKRGELADLQVITKAFPYADVFAASNRLIDDLKRMPVDVQLSIPERGLGSMPDILTQTYLTGRIKGTLTFRGTLLSPTVDLDAALGHSRLVRGAREEYIDFAMAAHYDGARATSTIKAKSGDKELLDVEAQVDAAMASVLEGKAGPWKAGMKAHFDGFPLEAIPVLDDRLISGRVNGDVAVGDLHVNGHANAALTVDGLKVGSVSYTSAKANADADGKALKADVRIEQPDGFFETHADAAASWGAAVAPSLDPGHPLHANLRAKHFRVSVLLPFLDGVLDELDGWLDATTQVEIDPKSRGAKLSGSLALSKGVFEAAAGGGELHDVDAQVKMSPDGSIVLEKFSGSGLSGHVDATGSAKLNGMRLQSAKVVVTIPASASLPVSAGGAEIGNVDGRFELGVTIASGATKLAVHVPHVRVALPNGNTNTAQSLGPMASGIRVGARRGIPATFVLVPVDPAPDDDTTAARPSSSGGFAMTTDIADAEVVRGTDIKIGMSGKIAVGGPNTEVTGQIHLKAGGFLTVQGRKFIVESGTVTMNPTDPSNPEIVVRAGWLAPEGTTVFVTFTGPLKTGKVTLTSEPGLSQQEIVELITSGSTEGTQATNPSVDPTSTAISTVGGQATQPLNHMLGQLGLSAISVKIDSSEASAPRPEVEVQIAKDLSLELAVVLGQPPPGVNPDKTLLTLDWRFASRWSLASTVGDAGSTIFDLLWRKRY
jgi:translocation and assembly module TamB